MPGQDESDVVTPDAQRAQPVIQRHQEPVHIDARLWDAKGHGPSPSCSLPDDRRCHHADGEAGVGQPDLASDPPGLGALDRVPEERQGHGQEPDRGENPEEPQQLLAHRLSLGESGNAPPRSKSPGPCLPPPARYDPADRRA